jgi:diguanylate cyclase (GGDEF)-like protein
MRALANISLRGGIIMLVMALAVLVGGIWAGIKVSTDYLLYQDATATARNWANLLADTVTDLEQIAGGEQPSSESMRFFQWAQKSGEVFRYEIYNRQGYSQMASERGVTLVNISKYSPDAVRSLMWDQPVVDVRAGTGPDRPSFYSQAYVPVFVDGRPVAIVAAYVDQTAVRDTFHRTFGVAAVSLCLLAALSFGLPAIAWYNRTREKQQADRRIRFLAHHDPLTELPNRASLVERLSGALSVLPADGGKLALHFIDIDRFKEVNDTFGHDGGDFLLQTIAERLQSVVSADGFVARLGGDEFVVVQNPVSSREHADKFARRLAATVAAAVAFNEQEIHAEVSVGVALAPEDGSTAERLLKSADLALYRSKADGRNCIRFFSPEMDHELKERIELERAIRHAVANDGFELHYQPVYEMEKRRLVGFEALIRLRGPDGTLIAPMAFIPIAEEMRLIGRIGAWVLREACRTAATWPSHLGVAVNLSPVQFASGNLVDAVAAALQESGLAPHRLELEVTETLLLGDSEATMAELQKLKAMGVAVAMDDFGTGYSSLSYLWRFPFDKIKIDRSFMQGFGRPGGDAETVVKTIIALGRELDMRVTVEGVETAGQVAFLDQANADQVQGFYFGRPAPATEIAATILGDFQGAEIVPLAAGPGKLQRA